MVFFAWNSNFTKTPVMQDSPFIEVLEVVLVVLLIYFGFKVLLRWFGPMLLRYILKRIGRKFERKCTGFNASANRKREGEVTLEKKPKTRRKSGKDVGEYIDYEEID